MHAIMDRVLRVESCVASQRVRCDSDRVFRVNACMLIEIVCCESARVWCIGFCVSSQRVHIELNCASDWNRVVAGVCCSK